MITNNSICGKCGGICCQGKLSGKTACKWLTSTGCVACEIHRCPACLLYPFVLIEDTRFPNTRRVFLDTACPHFLEFAKYLDQIKKDDPYQILVVHKKFDEEDAPEIGYAKKDLGE